MSLRRCVDVLYFEKTSIRACILERFCHSIYAIYIFKDSSCLFWTQ